MTQTDNTNKVGLSHLYNFILLFGSLSFLMWWVLILVLSPLWGNYLWEMRDLILARAEFMLSKGLEVSPSIEIFKHLAWKQIIGVGSLLGFLFYALPIALVLAFFEALSSSFQNRSWRWCTRVISLVWLLTPLGEAFHAFTSSYLISFLIAILSGFLCFSLSYFLKSLRNHKKIYTNKTKVIVIIVMLLSVSHFLTHPVLDMAMKPKQYQEIDPMTLVRDWLLLNRQGENIVNSWYYHHSPIAMEREMITVFQPMVVGLIGVDEKVWMKRLTSYFSTRIGQRWTRLKFIKLDPNDPIEDYLNNKWVDFIALGEQQYPAFKERCAKWPELSFAFFGLNKNKIIPPKHYYTLQNFYGPQYQRWGDTYRATPVLKRKEDIQDRGFNLKQTEVNTHHKRALGTLLQSPFMLLSMLIVLLGGALWALYLFMLKLAHLHIVYVFILPVLMSYYWIPGLKNNFIFWSSESGLTSNSMERKIFALNEFYDKPDLNQVDDIIDMPLSEDLRLGMWQVACLGKVYRSVNAEQKAKIIEWMGKVMTNYHEYPFNFRYKIIQAAVNLPNTLEPLQKVSTEEKQVYVRWYAESFGLGLK